MDSAEQIKSADEDKMMDKFFHGIMQLIRNHTSAKEVNFNKGSIKFLEGPNRYEIKITKKQKQLKL